MRLALLLLGVLACSGSADAPDWGGRSNQGAAVTLVEAEPATTGQISDHVITTAVVESEHQANLVPPAAGVVRSVNVEEGDRVSQAQELAIIENIDLDASAEASAAEVRKLEQDLARVEALAARGAASEHELEEARFQLESARRTARQAHQTRGQTRLAAPFPGVIARKELNVGEYVSASQEAFRLVDPERLRVVVALPERDLDRVSVDQPVELVGAYDPEIGGQGRVLRVAPVVDPESGTFRATIEVDPETSSLRAGQYVSVRIEVERREEVLVLPRPAVVWEGGRPVVYRMVPPPEEDDDDEEGQEAAEEDGQADDARSEPEGEVKQAERVLVELGLTNERLAQIVSGLEPGDQVVTVGQSALRDGALVQTAEMRAKGTKEKADEQADLEGPEGGTVR